MRAVQREARATVGEARIRETHTSAVPCAPHRISTNSQRQIC
jgi:hypothetical protein